MKKVYLFVYSNSLGGRDEVRSIVDSISQITNWIYDMPNSFFLQSDSTANQLIDLIKAKIKGEGQSFFITEVDKNRQGYITQDMWNFINNKN